MKRTLKTTIGAIGLVLAGIGGLSMSTPAEAAYVKPYVPPGCTLVANTTAYPYQYTGAPTTTGWYVYCGSDVTRFQTRAGNNPQLLPTTLSPGGPELRQKFQAANITLYVFVSSDQAASLLGTTNIPADVTAPGILGVTKTSFVAPLTTPMIAVFEQPKNSSGVPTPIPTSPTNLMYNFDEGLAHETGHAIDWLATTTGSSSAAFQARVNADIAAFNLRNGCALSGPDVSLWGASKSVYCNGSGGRNANYPEKTYSNLRIVREAGTGEAYQRYFMDAPRYNELWAQLIAIKRNYWGATSAPAFVNVDGWMQTIYVCSKKYTDQLYMYWSTPSVSCP